jgi:hypothetical protein
MQRSRRHAATLPLLALLTIAVPQPIVAQSSWRVIGKPGDWSHTGVAIGGGNVIYSVAGRELYWTNLSNGNSYVVANGYQGTRMLVWMDGFLYSVQDNNLYVTNTDTGEWRSLGDTWGKAVGVTGMNGYLWSLEPNGTLYRTDKSGEYQQVGRTNALPDATFLVALDGTLYAIADYTLYAFNVRGSEWRAISPHGDELDTVMLQSSGGYLWSLNQDGSLDRSDMKGGWELVGRAGEYKYIDLLILVGTQVYAMKDGTLYRTR